MQIQAMNPVLQINHAEGVRDSAMQMSLVTAPSSK